MHFRIIGLIREIETNAIGNGIRDINRLNRIYGKVKWRKVKGICRVALEDGAELEAEVHWYDGHGVGKKEVKIKRYL